MLLSLSIVKLLSAAVAVLPFLRRLLSSHSGDRSAAPLPQGFYKVGPAAAQCRGARSQNPEL